MYIWMGYILPGIISTAHFIDSKIQCHLSRCAQEQCVQITYTMDLDRVKI